MIPVRDWMRDRRVAAALAAVAIVFVGYRVVGSGRGSAPAVPIAATSPSPPVAAQEPPKPSAAPAAMPPASPAAIPSGWTGPVWSWNRNPFLAPAAEKPQAGRAAGNAGADPGVGAEGSPMPDLRGTVVSGSASIAIFRSRRSAGGNLIVPLGGAVDGWTVYRVEPYRVSLRRGKEIRVVELYKQ